MTMFTAIAIAILILALTPSKEQMAALSPPARISLQIVRGVSKVLLYVAAFLVLIGLLLLGLCLASVAHK